MGREPPVFGAEGEEMRLELAPQRIELGQGQPALEFGRFQLAGIPPAPSRLLLDRPGHA